jgi:hypothetical protein
VLQAFGDPGIGTPFTTANATAFINAVNGLSASGGDDCPELSMTGLLSAINVAGQGATLFLFTDASSKDSALAANVTAAASAKNIQVNMNIFGSCSPIDPVYGQVARQTGGQLFVLQQSEASAILSLATPQLGAHPATLLSTTGVLKPGVQTVDIPVNANIAKLTVSVSMDTKGSITLLQPNGAPVTSGPTVVITSFSAGQVITKTLPTPGLWRLQFSGSGSYSVSALASLQPDQVDTSIDLRLVEFETMAGRTGHAAYFPITGQPIAGTAQTILAKLYGPFGTATFSLVAQDGSLLLPLVLAQGDSNAAATDFVGTATLPSQPFRVAVKGNDTSGNPYQRVFPELFQAQSVSVTPISTVDTISVGVPLKLQFSVTNSGAANTFAITAADNCGVADNCKYVTGISPASLTLGPGASGTIDVTVNAPKATVIGTIVPISVSASSTSPSGIGNTANQTLRVALPHVPRAAVLHDLDNDGKTDLAVFRPSNGVWYLRYSSLAYATNSALQWGLPGDVPISGDFDGDGKIELTVWRPSNGTWYIRYSSLGYDTASAATFQWGLPGDIPLGGDFDADGKTDLAVWRPSNGTWYVRYSSLGYAVASAGVFQWGLPGDVPIAGDFDGDRMTDLVVWRPSNGTWYVRYSSLGYATASAGVFQWGLPGDVPIAGDFDGDGKTELAVWRPSNGTWYIRYSSLGYAVASFAFYQWGLPGDVPMAADFDGDGKTELSVFRPSTGNWFIRYSSQGYDIGGYVVYQWGLPGDALIK